MAAKISTQDWNERWAFAREQAHKEMQGKQQRTIRAKHTAMLQTARMTPSIVQNPEFSGYIVGVADLLTSQD